MFEFVARFVSQLHQSNPARKSRRPQYRKLSLQALDPRLMLSVTPGSIVQTNAAAVIVGPLETDFPTQQQIDQQMGLPMLDSLPGAPATLYLDFNGNFLSSWTTGGTTFTNVSTPVWDTDGNTSNYSAAEQAVIKEVWARVAEDYAPFNINVSTDYYGAFNNGQALRVAIGGSNNDWLRQDASGISSIGSFHDNQPNVVFAFDMVAWAKAGVTDGEGRPMNGPEALATTISHEAGHSFGLLHHSSYDSNGKLLAEYNPGSSNWTPIMGNNKADDRTTWAFMPTDQGRNDWQDDMAVIGGSANGFGFRPDDHGNTISTADALVRGVNVPTIMSSLTGAGVISQSNDVDAFKFTASGGTVHIQVDAAKFGPSLMPTLHLYSSTGLYATGTIASLTRSIIDVNLPAGGTYYLLVGGLGDYGDVGQYTVTVSTVLKAMPQATNATAFLDSQPSTTTSTSNTMQKTATPALMNAGNGQGETFVGGTKPDVTCGLVTQVTPQGPINLARLLDVANSAPVVTQRITNALRPALVDAVFALGLV